jgi:hypothetical protein
MDSGDIDVVNRITDILTLPPSLPSLPLLFLSTMVVVVYLLTTSKPEVDTDISVGRSNEYNVPAIDIPFI